MSCRRARDIMEEKAAREINGCDEEWLQSHLRECPECAAIEGQLDRSWEALAAHPSVEPSAEFLPKLRSRIQAERNRSLSGWHRRPMLKWQLAALAVCVLITAVLLTKHDHFLPNFQIAPKEAAGPADRDRADDQFLQDLETTLQNSIADTLSTYDSWTGMVSDPKGPEANKPKPAEGVTKKKEPA
jgi:hypothetical protein